MADAVSNDNAPAPAGVRDVAHGQAALLLVESLIHGLIAKSLISVADAVEIVEVAADVRRDIGGDLGKADAVLEGSMILLENISRSLRHDLEDNERN